jgi:hypothetical protein
VGTCSRQKRFDETENLQMKVHKSLGKDLGEEHENILQMKLILGATYMNQARPDEAAELWTEVLNERNANFGEDDPATLSLKTNIGLSYTKHGFLDRADAWMRLHYLASSGSEGGYCPAIYKVFGPQTTQ